MIVLFQPGDQGCENMADTLQISCGKHYCCEPVFSAFSPLGHHSLMTDQSWGPYVVMSCSLRVKGRGLWFPSVWVCGTFQRFSICMVVRRTIKPRLSFYRRLGPLDFFYPVVATPKDVYILMVFIVITRTQDRNNFKSVGN